MSLSILSKCSFIRVEPQIDTDFRRLKKQNFLICVLSVFICGELLSRFQNVFDAANWNDNPVGAIVELVTDFVDSFVEEIGFEKNLEIVGILRDKHRTGSGLQITLEKGAAHLAIPNVGPTLEKGNVFCAHGGLPERAVGGVLKRAHHPGDVAQCRAFEFALAQWPRRFAFEIENDEVFSGGEHLTEMIVAVDPDFGGIRLAIEQT